MFILDLYVFTSVYETAVKNILIMFGICQKYRNLLRGRCQKHSDLCTFLLLVQLFNIEQKIYLCYYFYFLCTGNDQNKRTTFIKLVLA
jgi:hypothetical protein